jgi:hypothetical protein
MSMAQFGTLPVDEAGTTLVFRIQGSTFPHWDGAGQRRTSTLGGDELTDTSASPIGEAAQGWFAAAGTLATICAKPENHRHGGTVSGRRNAARSADDCHR